MSIGIATGIQDYEKLRSIRKFYIDMTLFIKEWWEKGDDVTLITRPRRFGKTLNMSMVNCSFSNKYANRGELFAGLKIWEYEAFRELQGTYPVILVTFAGVKGTTYEDALTQIKKQLSAIATEFAFLKSSERVEEKDRKSISDLTDQMSDMDAAYALNLLSRALYLHFGKKVLILLDEYDTPLQEAWINGYWDQMAGFVRTMFNNTFKTKPAMERAIMTGITRVSKESIFSDLNNLAVVTTTSALYATSFGFTVSDR